MNSTPFSKAHLFQELQKWPLADLRTLCFYFEIEEPALDLFYDNLVGETSTEKAQSLIRHLQRFERFQSWGHLRRILEANFSFMDATFLPSLSDSPTLALNAEPPITNPAPPALPAPRSFIGIEWIEISAGEFWMGEGKECHKVNLPTYWVAKTPITNAQYLQFVQTTGHPEPNHWQGGKIPQGKGNHPVVDVSWDDGMALVNWVEEQMGQPVLLPSEAEWEKVARGGLVLPSGPNLLPKRKYPWGDVFDKTKCNTDESGIKGTTSVGNYLQGASPYGVLDMSGNVWEWTRSLYNPYPYVADDGREALDIQDRRIVRGGSWLRNLDFARVTYRRSARSNNRDSILGFRVVCHSPSLSGG